MIGDTPTSTNPELRMRDIFLFALVAWPFYLNDLYLIPLTRGDNLALLWGLDVVFFCLIPAVTLLVLFRRHYFRAAYIGLSKRIVFTGVLVATGAALFDHYAITAHIEPWLLENVCCRWCAGYPFPAGGLLKWGTVIYAALSAAVLEEMIFRGILIHQLRKYITQPWVVILVAAALFALIHWCGGPGKLLATFLTGLLLTWIYLRRGRLQDAMLCHFIINILAFS